MADASLMEEFDAMMVRAGLSVPEADRDAVVAGYAELKQQLELLRGRPHTAEPSNVFRLAPFKAA